MGIIPGGPRKGFGMGAEQAANAFGYEYTGWPGVETPMERENEPARELARKLGGRVISREKFPDGLERDVFGLPRS